MILSSRSKPQKMFTYLSVTLQRGDRRRTRPHHPLCPWLAHWASPPLPAWRATRWCQQGWGAGRPPLSARRAFWPRPESSTQVRTLRVTGPASSQRPPSSPEPALLRAKQICRPRVYKCALRSPNSREGASPEPACAPLGAWGLRSLDRGSHAVPDGLYNQSPWCWGRGRPESSPASRSRQGARQGGGASPPFRPWKAAPRVLPRPPLLGPLERLGAARAQQSRQAARRGAATGAGPGDGHSVAAASARRDRNK